jgi:hypothetical protein
MIFPFMLGVTFSNEDERAPMFIPITVSVGNRRIFFFIFHFDEMWSPEESREDRSTHFNTKESLRNGKEAESDEEEEKSDEEEGESGRRAIHRRMKKKFGERRVEREKLREREEERGSMTRNPSDINITPPKYVQKVSLSLSHSFVMTSLISNSSLMDIPFL